MRCRQRPSGQEDINVFLSRGVTRFDFWFLLITHAMMWRMGCQGGDQSGGCCHVHVREDGGLGQDDMSRNKNWRVGAAL